MSDQLRCTTCGHYAVACEDEYKALKAELEDTEEAHGDDNHHLGVALIRIEALEADNAALRAEAMELRAEFGRAALAFGGDDSRYKMGTLISQGKRVAEARYLACGGDPDAISAAKGKP